MSQHAQVTKELGFASDFWHCTVFYKPMMKKKVQGEKKIQCFLRTKTFTLVPWIFPCLQATQIQLILEQKGRQCMCPGLPSEVSPECLVYKFRSNHNKEETMPHSEGKCQNQGLSSLQSYPCQDTWEASQMQEYINCYHRALKFYYVLSSQ